MYPLKRSKSDGDLTKVDKNYYEVVEHLRNNYTDNDLQDAIRCLIREEACNGEYEQLSKESKELLKTLRKNCREIKRDYREIFEKIKSTMKITTKMGVRNINLLIKQVMEKEDMKASHKLALISLCSSIASSWGPYYDDRSNITSMANVVARSAEKSSSDIRKYLLRSKSRLSMYGMLGCIAVVVGLTITSVYMIRQ